MRIASARLLSFLPFLLLPLGFFLALFHPATLDVTNAGWLIRGTDNGEGTLGLHAYLHDAAAGLSLHTGFLSAPEGVSVLFTDSNPLLALLLKPFAPWLPTNLQIVGPWILICLFLQVFFANALLRPHAPGALSLWAGTALLAGLPTLFNRFLHFNLMAHWLILWALWLFVDRHRARRFAWWIPLLGITALVHSYLLIMVAAIWASAMAERFLRAGEDVTRERLRLAGGAAIILAMTGGIAVWLGAGGRFVPTDTYGFFSLPLDALWNPANPSYSMFLPAIAQRAGRGLEGFQYLGLGLLLLIPIALVVARRAVPGEAQRDVLHRLIWLAPALTVLTLLALTNYIDIAGHRLPRFALPTALAPLFDLVRASGRLFWPVAYVFVYALVLCAYRLGAQRAGLWLAALFSLQMADLAGMFAAIRATSAQAGEHRLYVRTTDSRWNTVIGRANDVAFSPIDVSKGEENLALFQEVAWRATSLGCPVRTVYAARVSLATRARQESEQAAFLRGDLAPGRLYVLLSTSPLPASNDRQMIVLDGIRVILP